MLFVHLNETIQGIPHLTKTGRGYDDGVAAATDVLGDPEETAARVFAQDKGQSLPFDRQTFDSQRIIRGTSFRFRGKHVQRKRSFHLADVRVPPPRRLVCVISFLTDQLAKKGVPIQEPPPEHDTIF